MKSPFNFGNGVVASFGYSADRLQLTSLSYVKGAQTLFGLNYWYKQDQTNCAGGATGNIGQIQCITDTVDAGRTVTYTYDGLYRLKTAQTTGSANYPQWGLSWTYDRYGNRLSQSQTFDGPPTNSVTVNPATNRITDPGYGYDANGNMTGDGLNTLTYDGENRAVTSAGGGTMSTYTYDGNSLRVKKQVGSGTAMVYIFSGTKVIAEYGAGANPNSPAKEYIYTGGQLLATIAGSTTTYHHADHLSARVNTDTNGNVAGQQGHYPYGESWYATNTTTKWQFTTYERDGGINESGNDYAMMRYHVNRLGRFSSPDRIAGSINNPQLLNRFAYVRNDPLNLIDPFGLQGCAADTCIDVKGSPDYFDTTNWVSGSGWDSSWWWGGGGGLSDPPGIPLIYRPGGGPGGGGVPDIRGPIPGGNAYDLSTLIPAPVPPVSPCQITGSFDPTLHPANDIRTPDGYGTPIYAPASGQIVGSRSTGWTVPQPFNLSQPPPLGSTNFVRFRTDSGYSVTYAHVSPIVGPQLATILGNSLIGRTDNSGRQTAPHVHVSVVDPRGVTIPPNWYFTDCE